MTDDERRLTDDGHCERSEAIQGGTNGGSGFWIASSAFGLLAMTSLIHRQPFIGQSSLATAACSGHTST